MPLATQPKSQNNKKPSVYIACELNINRSTNICISAGSIKLKMTPVQTEAIKKAGHKTTEEKSEN
jgi:hypothetical protein